MSLDPLFDGSADARLDYHRRMISIAADRASRFAGMVLELIEMREDDRAQAMRGALAEQMTAINKGFSDLGRALRDRPAEDSREHFQRVGTPEHRAEERSRFRHLEEDAEADAAAAE